MCEYYEGSCDSDGYHTDPIVHETWWRLYIQQTLGRSGDEMRHVRTEIGVNGDLL